VIRPTSFKIAGTLAPKAMKQARRFAQPVMREVTRRINIPAT
jgi:hypothetical protein